MVRKIIELDAGNGETVLVAVEVPEVSVGRVAVPNDVAIEKVDRSLDTVRDLIIRGCHPITQAFKALQKESQPAFAEVEFGINTANILLAVKDVLVYCLENKEPSAPGLRDQNLITLNTAP
jgi:Trypsin-co-occurring domain 1